MLGRRRANRVAVERTRQRLAECDEPPHLRDARGRLRRLDAHLFALADLIHQEDYGEDEECGHELQAAAMVDFARPIEELAEGTRRHDEHGDREAANQKGVVPSKNAHRAVGSFLLSALLRCFLCARCNRGYH